MKLGGLGIVLITLIAAGCGGNKESKNPAREFANLREAPISNEKPATQAIAGEALAIDIDDNPSSITVPTYMEGQVTKTKLAVRALHPGIQGVNLSAEGLPADATLEQQSAFVWILSWRPPSNFVNPGQSAGVKSIKFIAQVTKAADSRLLRFATVQSLPLIVTKNLAQPRVLGINGIDANTQAQEGSAIPFSIDVVDPTGSPTAPELSFTSDLPNSENFKADANPYRGPHPSAPASQSLGGGKWRFNYVLDFRAPHVMPIAYNSQGRPDLTVDHVKACFNVSVVSGLRTASAAVPACIKVIFEVRSAVAEFPAEPSKFSAAGNNAPLKFKVSVPGEHGVLKLNTEEVNKQLAKWDGGANLQCALPEGSNAAECLLQFQPTCKAKANYILKLRATTEVGTKGKRSVDLERKIEVVKPQEVCAPAKATEAPKAASTEAASGASAGKKEAAPSASPTPAPTANKPKSTASTKKATSKNTSAAKSAKSKGGRQ